jgi:hypothetical protein
LCVPGHVGHWVTPYSRHRLYRRLLGLPIVNQCDNVRDCIRYVGDFVTTCVVRCIQYTSSFRYGTKPLNLIYISYVIVLCVIRSGIAQSL